MLVCAPTGAGKTNVAMLTINQAIKQHIVNGVIKKDAFKIVYVAPMKALAAEMAAGFGKRYSLLRKKKKKRKRDRLKCFFLSWILQASSTWLDCS